MKALFLDRDGVINELIYYQEHGVIDFPCTVEQFRLLHGVGEAINKLHEMDYKVILVYSNWKNQSYPHNGEINQYLSPVDHRKADGQGGQY